MHPSSYLLAAAVFAVPTHTIAAYCAGPRWVALKALLFYHVM